MPDATAVPVARRYGDTAQRRLRNRVLLIALGVFIAAVMILWAVWAGLGGNSNPALNANDASYHVIDSHHVRVSITVDAPAESKVSCGLQAQNIGFTDVGYKVVNLPPSSQTSRTVTRTLLTLEPAVSGSLDQCWFD